MYTYGTFPHMILLCVRKYWQSLSHRHYHLINKANFCPENKQIAIANKEYTPLFVPYLRPLTPNMHNCMGRGLASSCDFDYIEYLPSIEPLNIVNP